MDDLLSKVGLYSLYGLFFLGNNAQAATASDVDFTTGNLWLWVCTVLVFIMHLGFSALEAGLAQRKNTANILFKNLTILAIGLLTYAIVGFNLMYPGEGFSGAFFGFAGPGLQPTPENLSLNYNANYTYWTDFLFQAMFAATAATIVSGAVAERVKLEAFLIFGTIYVAIVYPIIGMWKWGGGFLDTLATPFYDFAGSTIVHSVGGWAALACAILLGPRLGRFSKSRDGQHLPHNMPLATIGVFLLFFGWFGFNGGSVLSAEPFSVSRVLVMTALAGAAGIIGALFTTKIIAKNFDLGMILNGALAGLVAVTAGADLFNTLEAVLIGTIGGVIVVPAVYGINRLKIDDPVSAISVHLVCGIWGTLAVGLFGDLASTSQLLSQLIGIAVVGAFAFSSAYLLFWLLKVTIGVRVSGSEEHLGLDQSEHGQGAYHGLGGSIRRPANRALKRT